MFNCVPWFLKKMTLRKSKVVIIDNFPPVLWEEMRVYLCQRTRPCKCMHGRWHQLFLKAVLICWVGGVDSEIHNHTFMLVFSAFCPFFWITSQHDHVHPKPLNPRTQRNRLQHRQRALRLRTLTFCWLCRSPFIWNPNFPQLMNFLTLVSKQN